MASILWIENQMGYLGAQKKTLLEAGYEIKNISSVDEAVSELETRPASYDLIILDVLMGSGSVRGRPVVRGMTGLVVYQIIREDLHITVPVIFLSVIGDVAVSEHIRRSERSLGLKGRFLTKPIKPSELLRVVNDAVAVKAQVK